MGDVPTGPGTGGPPPPPMRSTCDSQECQAALAAVADDRNRVLSKCAQVEATRGRMNLLAAIAAAFATLAVAALVGAAAASGTFFGIQPASYYCLSLSCSPQSHSHLAHLR